MEQPINIPQEVRESYFIVYAKKTYQTSEDTWERASITFIASEQTTIGEIFQWANNKELDVNTIRIFPNTNPDTDGKPTTN